MISEFIPKTVISQANHVAGTVYPSAHSSTQQSGPKFIRGAFKLLWFELEMSPKGSYSENLVPSQDALCLWGGQGTLRWCVLAWRSRPLTTDGYWRLQPALLPAPCQLLDHQGRQSLCRVSISIRTTKPSHTNICNCEPRVLSLPKVAPLSPLIQEWERQLLRICFSMAFFF